jgi:hypothetical protein
MQAYQFKFDFMENLSQVQKDLAQAFDKIEKDIAGMKQQVDGVNAPIKNMQSGFGGIGRAIAGAFAVNEVYQFGKESVGVFNDLNRNAELLKMKLGEATTNKMLKELEIFADKMGGSISAVQYTFVSLVNRGFVPTIDEMRKLSDFAISSKKPIEQYMEAVIDAETLQYERLIEFGVKMKTEGNQVIATYNGVTSVISNNSKSIRGYLLGLGNLEGIKGASEKLGAGLAGNMQRWQNVLTDIKQTLGTLLEPFLNNILPKLSQSLISIKDWIESSLNGIKGFVNGIQQVVSVLQPIFEVVKKGAIGAFNVIQRFGEGFFNMLSRNQPALQKITNALAWIGDIIISVAIPAFDLLGQFVTFLVEGIIQDVADIIQQVENIGSAFAATFNFIYNLYADFYGAIIDIIDSIFPGFRDAFESVKNWLYNTFIKPISDWFGALFSFKGITESVSPTERGSDINDTDKSGSKAKPKGLGINEKLNGGGSANGVSGGTNIKHITINIGKLVERQEFHAITMKESASEMKRVMTEIFMSVANDVNYSN